MSEEKEIKLGDVVILNSGGTKMVVDDFYFDEILGETHEDKVKCFWFDDKNDLQTECFKITSLTKIE